LGRKLGLEETMRGAPSWMGLVSLQEDIAELSLFLCYVRTQWLFYKSGRGFSPEPAGAGILIKDFQPPDCDKIHFC